MFSAIIINYYIKQYHFSFVYIKHSLFLMFLNLLINIFIWFIWFIKSTTIITRQNTRKWKYSRFWLTFEFPPIVGASIISNNIILISISITVYGIRTICKSWKLFNFITIIWTTLNLKYFKFRSHLNKLKWYYIFFNNSTIWKCHI